MSKAGNYHINKKEQLNGDHELHLNGCIYQPPVKNRLQLGYHLDCQSAIITAKNTYPKAYGCYYCSEECHQKLKEV